MKFIPQGECLTIQFEGLERLWALKSRLEVPHSAILEVDYRPEQPALQDFGGYLRFPGTSLPWWFLAGTFVRKHDHEFWFVHMRQLGLLQIELKPGSFPYRQLRISCNPEIAQAIADWWQQARRQG